jgi:hypothetical protein
MAASTQTQLLLISHKFRSLANKFDYIAAEPEMDRSLTLTLLSANFEASRLVAKAFVNGRLRDIDGMPELLHIGREMMLLMFEAFCHIVLPNAFPDEFEKIVSGPNAIANKMSTDFQQAVGWQTWFHRPTP